MANTSWGELTNIQKDTLAEQVKVEYARHVAMKQIELEQEKMMEMGKSAAGQIGPERYRLEVAPAQNGGYVIMYGNDLYIATEDNIGDVIKLAIVKKKMS